MNKFSGESGEMKELAKSYLESLLLIKRDVASEMIIKAIENGADIKKIYIDVFESSQHEVGRLWQNNLISVAQEHYCTAATQMIMSQLYPYIFKGYKNGHRLVATCVEGEMHEIGVRIVSDFFEMEGWDTYYLGANTPNNSIVETLIQLEPEVIAISASIPYNLGSVVELINAVRKSTASKIKILVGGRPFSLSPELWKKVGADGYASNALEAVSIAKEFISNDKNTEESHAK
ncbi:MAG: cobalamin-dependent protein [Methanobacteriaceae archaeon]|nr:cobalamin-dependent protein [Methanobacteriaceae archaeon]